MTLIRCFLRTFLFRIFVLLEKNFSIPVFRANFDNHCGVQVIGSLKKIRMSNKKLGLHSKTYLYFHAFYCWVGGTQDFFVYSLEEARFPRMRWTTTYDAIQIINIFIMN